VPAAVQAQGFGLPLGDAAVRCSWRKMVKRRRIGVRTFILDNVRIDRKG
jgi:hypothetical protein